jgi:diketogulonate reductase-like aldo/keto reductase
MMNILTRRDLLRNVTVGLGMAMASGESAAASKPHPLAQRAIPAARGKESLPVVGMGTWNTFDVGAIAADRAPLNEVLQTFYAAGASVIDTSPMYGRAEAVTGDLVQAATARERTFLATKVWTSGVDKGAAQIENSMRLLRAPRLDLLQIHNLLDWQAHLNTLRALKDAGRVRYLGITHYTVEAHAQIESVLKAQPFDFAQFNFSIATRAAEQHLLPFCQERGVAVLINRPFEEGALFTQVAGLKLPGYARDIDCTTWSQFFLKYIVSHPAVTCVIPATSRVAHMRDNIKGGSGRMPDAKLRQRMAKDFDRLVG